MPSHALEATLLAWAANRSTPAPQREALFRRFMRTPPAARADQFQAILEAGAIPTPWFTEMLTEPTTQGLALSLLFTADMLPDPTDVFADRAGARELGLGWVNAASAKTLLAALETSAFHYFDPSNEFGAGLAANLSTRPLSFWRKLLVQHSPQWSPRYPEPPAPIVFSLTSSNPEHRKHFFRTMTDALVTDPRSREIALEQALDLVRYTRADNPLHTNFRADFLARVTLRLAAHADGDTLDPPEFETLVSGLADLAVEAHRSGELMVQHPLLLALASVDFGRHHWRPILATTTLVQVVVGSYACASLENLVGPLSELSEVTVTSAVAACFKDPSLLPAVLAHPDLDMRATWVFRLVAHLESHDAAVARALTRRLLDGDVLAEDLGHTVSNDPLTAAEFQLMREHATLEQFDAFMSRGLSHLARGASVSSGLQALLDNCTPGEAGSFPIPALSQCEDLARLPAVVEFISTTLGNDPGVIETFVELSREFSGTLRDLVRASQAL